MNKRGSLTFIAILFLLLTVSTLLFQINIFQKEQLQDQILIEKYKQKIDLLSR